MSAMELVAFCSPLYEDVALNELGQALEVRVVQRLLPGAFLLRGELSLAEAVQRSEGASLTFTRQVVAGIQRITLPADFSTGVADIVSAAPTEARETDRAFVCHSDGTTNDILATLQRALCDRLARDTPVGNERARALAVVVVGSEALVGLALRSPWPAGRPQLHIVPEPVSRAAFKLLEALDVFAIPVLPGGQALDLGASPGGWTQVLAGRGLHVVAVDPGVLDPRVATLPGVDIHRVLAQTYLASTAMSFSLVVNDMRLDARESAAIMVQAARLFEPGGVGLMTFKLPERAPTPVIRQAQSVLRQEFPRQEARCLYYNRREMTVCLRRQSS